MIGCDAPPFNIASAACCVAPFASAPRFLAILMRDARNLASSNRSVFIGAIPVTTAENNADNSFII